LRTPAPGVRRATVMGPASANLHRSGLNPNIPERQLCANKRLMHRSKLRRYSIISSPHDMDGVANDIGGLGA
jgi:hypothetical protein